MTRSAYIHIPFCQQICHYCDFNKVFLKNQPVDGYLNALADEMKLTLEKYPAEKLDTIFVGGGTPTALNAEQLEKLCGSIRSYLPFEQGEFTFEANPGDLTKDKLKVLKEYGVNRLSLGVQTFNDDLLRSIGRTHTRADVLSTIKLAQAEGFENISIDLIYALPNQTLEDFRETLDEALALGLPHYSGYSLIIEPKTVFYNLMRKDRLPLPKVETEAHMYELLMEKMSDYGLRQYEISNFAKPGYESLHNLVYWDNESYYGFGAGAHSYTDGVRRSNHGPLKKYMEPIEQGRLPYITESTLTKAEMMEEEMFLGLRKMRGVSAAGFEKKYDLPLFELFKEPIAGMSSRGLLKVEDGEWLQLTEAGKLLGNEVFQAFLLSIEN
ncbi:oxygen-independent coproporphyrinogen-3 oxidase [Bacillus ectoiniformans]|uniref:radical SAM family heme chaperone HemW n=1 Tax=Bacillus ectoiniformans TaxID=1494429 RepID=UPI00195B292B|nr:radical SAM family heme chaperone HemW [Bacillus ectoiniformans]MBM7649981.1 oxygen-independent coproporphyrinogen-3 oxidase [Bacillus ectoiniformans]